MAPNQFHQLAPFPPYRHTATIKEERDLLIQPIPKCKKNSFQWYISENSQSHGVECKNIDDDPTFSGGGRQYADTNVVSTTVKWDRQTKGKLIKNTLECNNIEQWTFLKENSQKTIESNIKHRTQRKHKYCFKQGLEQI